MLRRLSFVALCCWLALTSVPRAAERQTLLGTSTFPFAATPAASEQTFATAAKLGDLYVVQLDDGVPWREAAGRLEFPPAVTNKWASLRAHAPPGRPVYLALEPLGEDRVHLAAASQGSATPSAFKRAAFDDPVLVAAYIAYAKRAVSYFRPTYLNLGVENGELAQRSPADWPAYARMIQQAMTELRREHPNLPMGISFGLQSLMVPATAERARGLVEASDYIGISFYPYMSAFHEKFGTGKLPDPPAQWREPLAWLRTYTNKPVALTETGYNSAGVDAPRWSIKLASSPTLQADYIRDLAQIATDNKYLFVIYYFPIDIGPLLDTLPEDVRSATSFWRGNGLLGADLTPKPGLAAWQAWLAQPYRPPARSPTTVAAPIANPAAPPSLGFREVGDLCQAPAPAAVDLVDSDVGRAMQWSFAPRKGVFAWCARPVQAGSIAGDAMRVKVRSDAAGPLILELKTAAGEGYYAVVEAGPAWRDVTLSWADFTREEKTGPTTVDPRMVTKLIWADAGDKVPASGKRQVWLADWSVR